MCDPEADAASPALANVQDPDRLAALLRTELLDSACEAAFARGPLTDDVCLLLARRR